MNKIKNKKPSLIGLKKVIAELEKTITNLDDRVYELRRENKELQDEKNQKYQSYKETEYYRGYVEGMNSLLNRFQTDMSMKNKDLTEEQLFQTIQMQREGRY